jgi:lysophospholipase L1-like esterase
MKKRLILLFVILLVIVFVVYYFTKQSNPNQDINQTRSQEKEEAIEEIEVPNENDEEIKTDEQLNNIISDALKGALKLFFHKEFHVVAIGDSLTQGVGDSSGHGGYIGDLDEAINQQRAIVTFDNFGKSGRRTDQLIEALEDPEVISSIKQTDIVLMTIGANDIMKVVQQNFANLTYSLFVEEQVHFEERLNNIFIKIKEINPNTHIYLLGLYNPFEMYFQDIEELDLIVDAWNQTGEQITAQHKQSTFIPIKDLFDETAVNLFAEDHFHPNEIGYERMAERVLEYLIDGEWLINEQTNEEG